jgi:hypothetical protein
VEDAAVSHSETGAETPQLDGISNSQTVTCSSSCLRAANAVQPEVVGEFFVPPTSKSRAARRARPKNNAKYLNSMRYNENYGQK